MLSGFYPANVYTGVLYRISARIASGLGQVPPISRVSAVLREKAGQKTLRRGDVEPLGEYSIFDAPGRIGGQPDIFLRFVTGDSFNKSDGADRD